MGKTVIDSLIVTLGLDAAAFKKGTAESERISKKFGDAVKSEEKKRGEGERKAEQERKAAAKSQQERDKTQLDALRKVRNETLAFLSIFTAGKSILGFASDAIKSTQAIGKLSDNIGMSVEEISGWQVAMQSLGGTADQATGMLDKASTSVAAFRAGMPDQGVQGLFTAAGGTGVNLEGAFKDTKSFMLAQADVVHALYKRDPKDAMLKARQMMGIDPETFNLLKQGREAVMRQVNAGAKLSGVNKGQAEEAQTALRQWVALTVKLESVGRKILFAVLKPISTWMEAHSAEVTGWVDKLSQAISNINPETIETLVSALAKVAESLAVIVEALGTVAGKVGDIGGVKAGQAASERQNIEDRRIREQMENIKRAQRGLPALPGTAKPSINIGTITVHSAATDAHGIARDMNSAIRKRINPMVHQSNTGQP